MTEPRFAVALGCGFAAALITLSAAACARDETAQTPEALPAQTEPLDLQKETPPLATDSGQLSDMHAWINAMPGVGATRTLIITAKLETPCVNSEAKLIGVGGFGVTGRTYLARAEVAQPEICLTAMGSHELRLEVELGPEAQYDDVAIRLDSEMALIPLQIAQ